MFKTGDKVIVWEDNMAPRERIFLCMWEGQYLCVDGPYDIGEGGQEYCLWNNAKETVDE